MRLSHHFWATLLIAAACWAPAAAQQQAAVPPVQAITGAGQQQPSDVPELKTRDVISPDTHPVSGAEQLTLGTSAETRNQLVPTFHFTQYFDSNPSVQPGSGTNFDGVSTMGGSLALRRTSGLNSFILSYTGDGVIYNNPTGDMQQSTMFHSLQASQAFNFGRWTLTAADSFSYSPEAAGGYLGGFGGIESPLGFAQNYVPNQSVLTPQGSRYSNSSMGQVEYHLSRRSSITATGSYAIMRFSESSLFSGQQIVAGAGYNYSLSALTSVAVSYSYSRFGFESSTPVSANSFNLHYARRLPGRTMLHLSAGPQFVTADGLGRTIVSYFVSADAARQLGRTSLTAGYTHSTTGGAGVLLGAESDLVHVGLGWSFRRAWSLGASTGFARNATLFGGSQSYRSGSAGVQLSRSLGPTAAVYCSYSFERQLSALSCGSGPCAGGLSRHAVGFGFQWNIHPIRLD
ncbi:MAG: hypothetical protein LAO06_07490 [Acidobacteriia bacterium]|nr:hypothetical protein [Terriglobia bacterium]